MRISLKRETCDMPKYHNIFIALKTFDGDIWNFESVDFYCVINTIEIIFRATKKENYLLQPCVSLFQQPNRAFLGINDE